PAPPAGPPLYPYTTLCRYAGLQVDMMRTAHLAGILVLDIGRGLQRVGRAAHAALRRRGLSFWYSHGTCSTVKGQRARERPRPAGDRKSTRLNSSHVKISYA